MKQYAKVLEAFNRQHGAEAQAELLSADDKKILIRFSGHMCFTCGHHEYVEDLRILFEEQGLVVDSKKVAEEGNGTIVTFHMD